MSNIREYLRQLPKAHLHLHFEGAMRYETLVELSERYGLEVPAHPTRYESFADFMELYLGAVNTLRSPEDLVRLVNEIVDDNVVDGVRWLEIHVRPRQIAGIGTPSEELEIILEAGNEAAARTGIGVAWIVCADRGAGIEEALNLAELAIEHRHQGVVGFGLAADEVNGPPEGFVAPFAMIRDSGLLSIPHAGELMGPASITSALHTLGADRLEHGVRAIESASLLDELAQRQVCLDVCPTSNVILDVYPSLAEHPLRQLLEHGIACSINADDPLLFKAGVLDEYVNAFEGCGLSLEQLTACARFSLLHSGAPEELKRGLLAEIDALAPIG